jgi:hypothetical protein
VSNAEFIGGCGSQTHIRSVPVPPTARPQGRPQHPAPLVGAVRFRCNLSRCCLYRGRKNHMKLTTIALASALAVTSSIALAQAGAAVGGGTGAGTNGAAATGAAGSSSVGSSTGTGTIGNAPTGSSNGLSTGFSTGTYPTRLLLGAAVFSARSGSGNRPLIQSARSAESTTPP